MYRAKRRRGTFAFFEASQELELSKRVRIERDLEPGLAAGEFSLNFQPRIDMRTGLSDSVEALVRWEHPEMGPVSPVFFIPVAEESGQIHRLGNWIFDQACAQVAAWRRSGMSMRIAINLSVVELQASDIVERITRVLEKRGIAGEWIEIEITESAAMLNPEHSIDVITAFRDRGIEISIDDFGTGYSSLSYLKRIPANYLKIDRSFLQNITGPESNDSVDSDIIRAIVALGHSLGMEIIAEGVEMPGQQEFLSGHGCFLAQGYHYCKGAATRSGRTRCGAPRNPGRGTSPGDRHHQALVTFLHHHQGARVTYRAREMVEDATEQAAIGGHVGHAQLEQEIEIARDEVALLHLREVAHGVTELLEGVGSGVIETDLDVDQ
jgi:EAL domain-containing protein (putative c-di-GMP-specific phosphodiesterase class I)